MKTIVFITFLFISSGFSNFSFSQESKGKVTVIRPDCHWGSASKLKVFIDKKLVCKIQNKKYSVFELEPGQHNFAIQTPTDGYGDDLSKNAENGSRNVTVEAGNNYYLLIMIEPYGKGLEAALYFDARLYLQVLLGNSYKIFLKNLEEENECH